MAVLLEIAVLTAGAIGLVAVPALAGDAPGKRRELRIEYDAAPTVTRRTDALDDLEVLDAESRPEQFFG